jgi:hypothetical protein
VSTKVPLTDTEGLSAALEAPLSHPEDWPEMGRAGRAYIEAEFDLARQAERLEALYQSRGHCGSDPVRKRWCGAARSPCRVFAVARRSSPGDGSTRTM